MQLLDALEAVHGAGALHHDIKPANVLLRRNGDAVFTDFGRALDDAQFLTTIGELVGSLDYMAPERMTGSKARPASDLWSLGATLATACSGQSPFRRPTGPETLYAVTYEGPTLPEELGPLLPVVEALLRKASQERPLSPMRDPRCGASPREKWTSSRSPRRPRTRPGLRLR